MEEDTVTTAELLVDKYADTLFRIAIQNTGVTQEAEDIAKVVFAEKNDSLREETFTLALGVATKDAEGNYTIDGIYQDVLMGDKARYTVENTDMLNIVVDNRRHAYRILFSMLNEIQIFVNY